MQQSLSYTKCSRYNTVYMQSHAVKPKKCGAPDESARRSSLLIAARMKPPLVGSHGSSLMFGSCVLPTAGSSLTPSSAHANDEDAAIPFCLALFIWQRNSGLFRGSFTSTDPMS